MVTTLEDRTRGQLILIGAIAIAFIILGLVVVFNGLLFTQTTSSGETLESASNAEDVELEINRSVGQVVQEVNRESNPDIENTDIEEFGNPYSNSTSNSRPTVVTVDYDSGSKDASRMDSPTSGTVYNASNEESLVLGQLLLKEIGSNDRIDITFDNEDTLTVDRNGDNFDVSFDSGPGCDFLIDAENDEDVNYNALTGKVSGESIDRECNAVTSEVRGSYQNISFDDPHTPDAFEIVVKGSDFEEATNPVDVYWTVEVRYTYDSRATSVEKTDHTIEVYGENL